MKKHSVIISIISGVDDVQAANIQRDLIISKRKNAPGSRATTGVVDLDEVKNFLQTNIPLVIEQKEED